ncbi:unnamed protein product [Blumeria hordei]|uniref:Major facilitator superfamily (MFS) profile domain-containing protein n=2 Tax=Blumeria hordei TaxID=2867405 RepID=A0A383UUE8_BLUHO|nr:unnamed protein product [Blumeria hordei]
MANVTQKNKMTMEMKNLNKMNNFREYAPTNTVPAGQTPADRRPFPQSYQEPGRKREGNNGNTDGLVFDPQYGPDGKNRGSGPGLSVTPVMNRPNSFLEENSKASPACTIAPTSPGRSTYSEKDGLRPVGDDAGHHDAYNSGSIRFFMTLLGCAFALAGSQIVGLLYLTLGTRISEDLGRPDLTVWLLSAGIIAMGSLAPFVGPVADLYGRKSIFLVGVSLGFIGAIVCAATPTAPGFIAGQALLGFGAVIEELMAISVVTEVVPTAKRGLYAALILTAIIPWSPGTLYADFMAASSWRWIGLPLAIWHLLIFVMIACFYFPPPRSNSQGLSRRQLFWRIDWLGGFLLTLGLLLILIALNWGGQQYAWTSSHVLSFLLIGLALLTSFGLWEKFGAEYPLYPRRIVRAPRPFYCILFLIFSAGINYIPLVVFWPIETIAVYGSDMRQSGINNLPIGTCILGGAIISALLIGLFRKHVTIIMTFFCIMQTCGTATLSSIDPHSLSSAWAPLCIALIGVGGVLVPNQIIITILTPDDLIASATALTVGIRSQAQVIGLAIYFSRFLKVLEKNAFAHLAAPIINAGVFNITVITNFIEGLASRPFDELAPGIPQLAGPAHAAAYHAVKEGAILTFKGAFDYIYLMSIGFGVAACIAAAAMGNVEQYIDDHVAVVLE